jgi:hypothetical protein
MKKHSKLVKEFRLQRQRAGFVPGYGDADVETWQVWCRSAESPETQRRATRGDMAAAGYVRAPKRGPK